MSKNVAKKTERPLTDKPNMDRSRNSYPSDQTNVENQPGRFKQSTPGTAEAVKATSERAVRVEFSPPAPKLAAKPPQAPAATNLSPATPLQRPTGTVSTPKPSTVSPTPPPKTVHSAQPAPSPKPAVLAQPQSTTAPRTISVNFTLLRPNAKQVWLCADFNGWSRNNNPLKRRNDGQWETTIALVPGRYQYKFLVDGEWIVDPTAKQNVANAFGTQNSVLEVRA